MDWQNLPGGGNVLDRRGGGGLPGGGLAVGGIGGLILTLVLMFLGIDPGTVLGGGPTQGEQTGPQGTTTPGQQDEDYQFIDRIARSNNDVWSSVFQQAGRTYTPPKTVLYSGTTQSGCGTANSAVGPFYCPLDNGVYIDTSFFQTMDRRLGGGGDLAYSYVIAHEIGHHVQNELGIADQVERKQRSAQARGNEAEANSYSVRLELQADCFAGVWASRTRKQTNLTEQDLRQAVNTAAAIGDDNLQKQGQGYVVPDSFTHGSSQQRVNWFMRGFKSADPNQCDSFTPAYNQL